MTKFKKTAGSLVAGIVIGGIVGLVIGAAAFNWLNGPPAR
jgi:hypothetical protein